jgi:hypothetical protein
LYAYGAAESENPAGYRQRWLVTAVASMGVPDAPLLRVTPESVSEAADCLLMNEAWCPMTLKPSHPTLRFAETLDYCATAAEPIIYRTPITAHVPLQQFIATVAQK